MSALSATLLGISAPLMVQGGEGAVFEEPFRLRAEDGLVKVESPGWAAPGWSDVDGDGDKDLLVGQFGGGKIRVYRNQGQGQLAAGEWLMAEGAVAEVPGVW